jgi:hypothetical protein
VLADGEILRQVKGDEVSTLDALFSSRLQAQQAESEQERTT